MSTFGPTVNCRSCEAPIKWAETEAGKLMPVDAVPSDNGNVELYTEHGKVRCRVVSNPGEMLFPVPLYTSHFATCPNAGEHRTVRVREHERTIRPPFQRGSATSEAAANAVESQAGTMSERVLACITEHGPLTDERIADRLNMNPSTVRPRRIELARAGRIEPDGTAATRSGRQAVRWRVTS